MMALLLGFCVSFGLSQAVIQWLSGNTTAAVVFAVVGMGASAASLRFFGII